MSLDTMTKAELLAALTATTSENLALKAAQPKPREISVKLSDTTGSIVVSGLSGRFPTTLYRSSWKRLLTAEVAKLILTFIKDNDAAITAAMTAAGKTDR